MKWFNEQTGLVTDMTPAHDTGDLFLIQSPGSEKDWDRRIVADYSYRPTFFSQLFLFAAQTGQKLPFSADWEKRFYAGFFDESSAEDTSDYSTKSELLEVCEGNTLLPFQEHNFETLEDLAALNVLPIADGLAREGESKLLFPYINLQDELCLSSSRLRKKIITLNKDDLKNAVLATINHMHEHRGHGYVAGFMYKNFPYHKIKESAQ